MYFDSKRMTWCPLVLAASPLAAAPMQQPDFSHFWGGETRQVFGIEVGQDRHVWTVGDGGLIRKRVETSTDPNPAWSFQTTPDDARQTLLDVYFEDEDNGWTCGVAGQVLETTNGGSTWTFMDQVLNGLSEPATLWRVRQTPDQQLFVAGLWTFQMEVNGDWEPVALKDETMQDEHQEEYEFYALEIVPQGSNGDWVGFLAGQEWRLPGGTSGPKSAVLFMAESDVAGGTEWRVIHRFNEGNFPGHAFQDPWDIEFDPDGQHGFLVGGTGFPDGEIYITDDGGLTWEPDPEAPELLNTQYGVAALGNGNAISVGYGGQIWFRDGSGSPPSWTSRIEPGYTAPLAGAHGHSGDDAWVTGAWGFVKTTTNGGTLWTSTSDGAEEMEDLIRFEDVRAVTIDRGFGVGPMQTVVEFTDGGSGVQADVLFGGINASGGISKNHLLSIDFSADSTRGVAVGEWDPNPINGVTQYAIVYTEDGGSSWEPPPMSHQITSPMRLEDVAYSAGSGSLATFWAVGRLWSGSTPNPLVLISTTGGESWQNKANVSQLGANTRLNGVAFVSATSGYCVGFDGTDSVAFEIAYSGSTASYTPIAFGGSFAGDVELLDVAATSAGDVVVVGRAGTILELDGSGDLVPMSNPPQPFGLDLHCVDMVGSTIMIGSAGPAVETVSEQLGRVLHWNGTQWYLLKASTNKLVNGISMLAADKAWLVASGDSDPEFGKSGDSALLTSE